MVENVTSPGNNRESKQLQDKLWRQIENIEDERNHAMKKIHRRRENGREKIMTKQT